MTALALPLPQRYYDALDEGDREITQATGVLVVRGDSDIEHMPPIAWLADAIIPREGLCAIYGAPGSGKSFVAIDLAFAVTTGAAWLGRAVIVGGALYVAAEGLGGLGQRVRAWKEARGFSGREVGVGFVTHGVDLLADGAAERIVAAASSPFVRNPCQLIVIDTLAQSMIGDENDTRDMSKLIATATKARNLSGATVLLVHHTKKDSDLERGSSALRGGVDTLILCEESDDGRQLVCQKQKDAEAFAPIPFYLSAGHGSCVVASTGGDSPAGPTGPGTKLTPQRVKALSTLREAFTDRGATSGEWMRASNIAERTFYRVRTWLVGEGYVTESGKAAGARYHLTESGRFAATATPFGSSASGPATLVAGASPPLKRGGQAGSPDGGSRNGSESGRKVNDLDDLQYADLIAQTDERLGMRSED
jgi:hypothetical protein